MVVGTQIRRARKARGFYQYELASQCGWQDGQSRISMYERGERDPSSHDVAVLGRALQVPTWWFYTDLERVPDSETETPSVRADDTTPAVHPPLYPVISWVSAGNWAEVIRHREPGEADHWMHAPPNVRCSANAFWTEVQGRSMIASNGGISYPPGTLILVDPEVRELVTGRLILALLEPEEVTFKRLNVEGGRIYLEPLNTQYAVIELASEAQIIGTIKAFSAGV